MIDKLKNSLFGDSETETRGYQCVSCRHSFESSAPSADVAVCPECGGSEVRVVVGGRTDVGSGAGFT